MDCDIPRKIDVIGMKQVLRGVEAGRVATVLVAEDAEPRVRDKILACCAANGVETVSYPSMRELGKVCGIAVGAACAGIRRAQ